MYALDRSDGTARWTYEIGAEIRSSPAIGTENVYVTATDGYLYALDVETGTRTWRFDGGRRLTHSPTIAGTGDDAAVYVGSQQGNVFAVHAATGTPRWSFHLPAPVETPPVVVNEYVFVGDGGGRVHALVDESVSNPSGVQTCNAQQTTTSSHTAPEDADNDGFANQNDYAPWDANVQRRADLNTTERNTPGFLSGIGVGSAVTLLGVGSGWWLRRQNESD